MIPQMPPHLGALVFNMGGPDQLFAVAHKAALDTRYTVTAPAFHINGERRAGFVFEAQVAERALAHGGREVVLCYTAPGTPPLQLLVFVQSYHGSPIIRWKYQLSAHAPAVLTKPTSGDDIRYTTVQSTQLRLQNLTDIQLSHFDSVGHTYQPRSETYSPEACYDTMVIAGPIAVLHDQAHTLLLAYEHGGDHPHSFLAFTLTQTDVERSLALAAREGNYYHGQPISSNTAWESVWFELGAAPIPLDAFLQRYRQFMLDEICEQRESRQPYLFYNTWNYQERNRYFRGRPYLESMTNDRMLAEIDIAHQLGIDVFVIDTGWYSKTGDWQVNTARFPDGLRTIQQRLESYGMRLGLWFNPTVAALTSEVYTQHPEWEMTRDGHPTFRQQVWETEESTAMCLCSDYADAHIAAMLRLREDLGVTYFKWDGIQQFGCDSPLHHHGTVANSAAERASCYAYQMGCQMIRIVGEVTRRYPDVIVDFDITERGRFVGLGFLSVGKYFLINNGPYFSDFDIPHTVTMTPNTINVFFYPGAARPRVCRRGVTYDPIIPSILFLTHYLPEGPPLAQRNSVASLVLGGNGIWGDLIGLSADDILRIQEHLALYKQVAPAATKAYPSTRGFIGASPEIHEKIHADTATGIVVFFSVAPGKMIHVTQALNAAVFATITGADSWDMLPDGRVKLVVQLDANDARVVYIRPAIA